MVGRTTVLDLGAGGIAAAQATDAEVAVHGGEASAVAAPGGGGEFGDALQLRDRLGVSAGLAGVDREIVAQIQRAQIVVAPGFRGERQRVALRAQRGLRIALRRGDACAHHCKLAPALRDLRRRRSGQRLRRHAR